MKNKIFFNKGADEAQKPSNMELLKKSITEFCHAIAFDEDEAKAALKDVHWDSEVDPVIYWKFQPICTFEVGGTHEMAHRLRHNRLFGQNGILLECEVDSSTSAMSNIMEAYELWLLEDMSLMVVFSCLMSVSDDENTERAIYRYPVKNGYNHFHDIDVEDFVTKVETMIFATRHTL